jgi:CMP-N,N'-diacetyllegionaminic acid synthase
MRQKILLTIAARGGSKGVKNKNIRPLCGLPLIAHSIKQAKRWGRADRIICSTDSNEIAQVAEKFGAEVPFIRPAHLATDTAGKLGVLRHALKTVEEQSGQKFSVLMDLDASAPVRRVEDIENVYQTLIKTKAKCVFSVTACRKNPYFNMVELNKKGYAVLVKKLKTTVVRRQDAPKVYDMNASIYAYDRKYILDEKTKTVFSKRSMISIMQEWSAFDIDTEADFEFIEFLVSKGIVKL